jgi:alanyl-tRNA synthetase
VPTERLYYTDAYLQEFDATVIELVEMDGRAGLVLDRTAFYPTSGGQPHDTGTLGASRIVDVVDRDDGAVVHVVEAIDTTVKAGGRVHGAIDWERRFEHMQQHTGQHVLSAAFEHVVSARTVSFHLGTERSTIDLDRDLAPADVARAEREANRVVWEDRPVSMRFVSDEEAAALPLRKEPKRTGKLRLVEVERFDLSACGGTHVARTGAIGLIAVSGSEKYKGGLRIEFVCGIRALSDFAMLRETVAGTIRQISVLPGELPEAVGRLQAEGKAQQKTIRGLQERLASFEAQAIANRAEAVGRWRVVVERADWDAGALKALAAGVAALPGHAAVFFNPAGGLVVAARAADVPLDASATIKELTAAFGGRGGGRSELAQAGNLSGDEAAILAAIRRAVGGALQP